MDSPKLPQPYKVPSEQFGSMLASIPFLSNDQLTMLNNAINDNINRRMDYDLHQNVNQNVNSLSSSSSNNMYDNMSQQIKKSLNMLPKHETNACNFENRCNKNDCKYWHPPYPICRLDLNDQCRDKKCEFYHFSKKESMLRQSFISGLKMRHIYNTRDNVRNNVRSENTSVKKTNNKKTDKYNKNKVNRQNYQSNDKNYDQDDYQKEFNLEFGKVKLYVQKEDKQEEVE
jgi:hypothetical protein